MTVSGIVLLSVVLGIVLFFNLGKQK